MAQTPSPVTPLYLAEFAPESIYIWATTRLDLTPSSEIQRVRTEFPAIAWTEIVSGHDVAGAAPEALVEAIRGFLAERVDSAEAAE